MLAFSTNLARWLHRTSIATVVLSSLFLSPTFAAAPIAGPGKTNPQIGSPASGGGEITSPGDPFLFDAPSACPGTRWSWSNHLEQCPSYDLKCGVAVQPGIILIINKGDTVIPKGTKLVVTLIPTGQTVIIETPANIIPNTAFQAGPFEGLDHEKYPDCRAAAAQL